MALGSSFQGNSQAALAGSRHCSWQVRQGLVTSLSCGQVVRKEPAEKLDWVGQRSQPRALPPELREPKPQLASHLSPYSQAQSKEK